MNTYEIIEGGRAIRCLRCGSVSHHPEDVAQRYCGGPCHQYHDLLARLDELNPFHFEHLAKMAGYVLWHYGERGPGIHEPGGFYRRLIMAMTVADPENMTRLGLGFPELAMAMTQARYATDGLARLHQVIDKATPERP